MQVQEEEVKQVEAAKSAFTDDYLVNMDMVDLIMTVQKVQMDLTSLQAEQRVSNQRQDSHNESKTKHF